MSDETPAAFAGEDAHALEAVRFHSLMVARTEIFESPIDAILEIQVALGIRDDFGRRVKANKRPDSLDGVRTRKAVEILRQHGLDVAHLELAPWRDTTTDPEGSERA